MTDRELAGCALSDFLRKEIESERHIAENNKVAADLLAPEFEKFQARSEPHNVYTVRMYVDHRNEQKRANKRIETFEQILAELSRAPSRDALRGDKT